MSKQKIDTIEKLCGLLEQHVLYSIASIKKICQINNIKDQNIMRKISQEIKKTNSRLRVESIVGDNSVKYYSLNPDINFAKEKEITERNTIVGMAKSIYHIIQTENKKHIQRYSVGLPPVM